MSNWSWSIKWCEEKQTKLKIYTTDGNVLINFELRSLDNFYMVYLFAARWDTLHPTKIKGVS